MKLAYLGKMLMSILALLLLLTCLFVLTTFLLNRQYQQQMQQLHLQGETISQLQLHHVQLTEHARSYLSTGETKFLQYYQQLLQQQPTQWPDSKAAALPLSAHTRQLLDELIALEQQAFTLLPQQAAQASALLFGPAYQHKVESLSQQLAQLASDLSAQKKQQLGQLTTQLNIASYGAAALLLLSLLLIGLVLRQFFQRSVLTPLAELTRAALRQEQPTAQQQQTLLKYQQRSNEIGALSRALLDYQHSLQQLAAQKIRQQQTQAWYQQIIDYAPDGMLIVDSAGTILIANPKVHQLLEFTPGSLVGMNVDDIVPPDVRPMHAKMRQDFMQNRQHRSLGGVHGEFRAVTSTGREFPVELGLTRLPPVDEHGLCACATLRDISQRKANEKTILDQLEFQRVLLDTLPYPVFFKDQSGKYLGFNQAYLQAFAVSAEQLIGKTVNDVTQLPAAEIPMYQQANQQVLTEGGSFKAETTLCYADGQWRPSLYMLSAFHDSTGRIAGTVGTLIDISAQKAAEQAHQQARQLAEDATQLKSDFLANMSHEIRTPMNIILGMAHLALEQQPERRQRNYLEKIQTSAQNLLGIINDILDFSKIEAGKMQLEHIDFYLEDILQRLTDQAMFRAQEKGLELLFDLNPQVPTALIGDPLRLSQILHNLLSNAIKFTEHGEITLRIRVEQQQDQQVWLQFEVNDTGIGMNAEQQQRLFQAFSQADSSTSRKYGGTGLGLNICKQLTELLGGSIGLDSEFGVGSTFYFRLPFALQQQQRLLTTDSTSVQGMSVLVVDDNPTARDIIQAMLQSLKFCADTAANGPAALTQIQAAHAAGTPYQLVMMDWKMPGMDGIETIRQLQQQAGQQAPFFVMVTAYNRDELLEKAAELSIQAVLVKPLTPSTLLDSILTAFGQQALLPTRRVSSEQAYRQAITALQGAYLLLVEDNPVNQEMAAEILQNAGIRVDIANNGAEAIAMISRIQYDGVLMDCQMPVMDGFEACRRIRLLHPDGKLPVLAMTANAMVGDKEKCLAAGMNDHIAKPIEVEKLFLTLQKWIKPARPFSALIANQAEVPAIGLIPGLSVDAALHRLGHNQALYHKLLLRFCQTQQDVMAQLACLLENCQQEDAVRLIHSFKGLAGNIGARELSELAGSLETALRFTDHPQIQQLQQTLTPLLQQQISAIRQALDAMQQPQQLCSQADSAVLTQSSAALSSQQPQQLQQLLQQLQQLLQEADGSAADYLLPHLPTLGHYLNQAQLASLQRLLSQFDYDAALPLVRALQLQLAEYCQQPLKDQ